MKTLEELGIGPTNVANAMKILADNGVDIDECDSVIQAIGYALCDIELQPLIDEVNEKDLF